MKHRNARKVVLLLVFFGMAAGCGGGGGGGGGEGGPVPPAGVGICSNAAGLVPNTFIVEIETVGETEEEIELECDEAADDNGLRLGGDTRHVLKKALRGFVMTLPEGESPERFFEDARVLRVEQDVEAAADVTYSIGRAINAPVPQVAPTGVRRIRADVQAPLGLSGVGIAILDSGIDLDHPDLSVADFTLGLGANILDPALPPADTFGHGTHVAGIAAALDNGFGVVGVAPGATLYPVKVLGDDGNGTMSDIIAGLDWVVANADKVAVANLSLHVTCPSPLLRAAVARAVAAGVVVVASAGNVGDDLYGVDGIYGTGDDRAPACFPEALTVSAMADFDGQPGGLATGVGQQDDTLVDYSNFSRSLYPGATWTPPGMGIDLAAPGYAILSTFPGGLYETMSGTSMAAPHVTGTVARLIAVRGRAVDTAGVTAIRQTLVDGGEPQSQWRPGGSTLDRDPNPEPLVNASAIGPIVP